MERMRIFRTNLKFLGQWKKEDYAFALLILCIGITGTILGALAFFNGEVQKDSKRLPISEVIFFASFIYSLAIIILVKLENLKLALILMLVFLFAIPIVLLITLYFTNSLSFRTSAILVSLMSVGILSLILRSLYSLSPPKYPFIGPLISSLFAIGLILLLLLFPFYLIVTIQTITAQTVYLLIAIISTGIAILLFSPWLHLQFKYYLSKKSYEENLPTLITQKLRLKDNHLRVIFSATIFAVFTTCIVVSIHGINQGIQLGNTKQAVIFGTLLVAATIYNYLGTVITQTRQVENTSKFYIFTLLFGVVPLGFMIPIYVFLPNYQYITKYFIVLPLFAMVVLAFLSLFSKPKPLHNICYSFLCLTLVFPIGFLYPLIDSGIFPYVPIFSFIIFLVSFPSLALLFVIYKAIKNFWLKTSQEKIKSMKSIDNYYYPTLYLIMIVFTFGEGILIYVFCTDPSDSEITTSLLGAITILPFVYTSSSITLQAKVNSPNEQENVSVKQKIQVFTFLFCIIAVLISLILLLSLEFLGNYFKSVFMSLCIGISLLGILTIILIQIKYKIKEYSDLAIIIGNIVLWILYVIPICIIFPIALSRSTNSKSINKAIGLLILYLGLLIMIFVSISSLIYNSYKNKMKKERTARKCAYFVNKCFQVTNIKFPEKIIRDMYDRYSIKKFSKDYITSLKNQELFIWENIENELQYKKEILTKEEFEDRQLIKAEEQKLKQEEEKRLMEEKKKKDEEEKKKKEMQKKKKYSFWVLLRLFNDYGSELSFKPPPPIIDNKPQIKGFEIDEMPAISENAFAGFIPANFETAKEPFPRISKSKPRSRVFVSERSFETLKIDRSARKDWLRSVFRFIANEQCDISAEPWINEEAAFLFCRKGGIASSVLSDSELREIYYKTITFRQIEVINEDMFVNLFFSFLADKIYPEHEPITQEKELFFLLYRNIPNNIQAILEESGVMGTQGKKDPFVKSLERTLTMKVENRLKGSTLRKNSIISLISKTEPIFGSTERKEDRYFGIDRDINYDYEEGTLQKCFGSIGKNIINTGKKISRMIENKLNQYYTVPREEDVRKNEENEFEEEAQNGHKSKEKNLIGNENNNEITETKHEDFKEIKEWEEAIDIFYTTVEEKRKEEDSEKDIEEVIHLNISNIFALVFKIMEVVQLSAPGFKKEISWGLFATPLVVTNTADIMSTDPEEQTIFIFWAVFALSLFYGFVGYRSFGDVKKGRAGRDENDKKATWKKLEWWKKKTLTVVGGGLYLFILKYIMNIYACEFNQDPPVIPKALITCYTPYHIGLMVSALVALIIYYPIATFLFPLMQFTDSDLVFKQNQTYLIVLAQAKLLIGGIRVFLPYSNYFQFQLLSTSIILFIVFVCTAIMLPCEEKRFNLWSIYGYFVASCTNFFAFLNVQIGGSLLLSYSYIVLMGIGLLIMLVLQGRLYGFIIREKPKEKKTNDPNVVPENEKLGDTFIMKDESSAEALNLSKI